MMIRFHAALAALVVTAVLFSSDDVSDGFHDIGITSVSVQAGTYGFRLTGGHYDGSHLAHGTFSVTVTP